jgi:hypothetical protein
MSNAARKCDLGIAFQKGRAAAALQQPLELKDEPSYWEEKRLDRREEFREEADLDRERAYPRREP